ncbi:hypothetical protein, partial [Streptococcus sp. NLN64]|uniref:hypothetical protein n=1 Tax=Streptococcus sp. NLN64 TaxID=2822799 RepID=UPI001B355B7D
YPWSQDQPTMVVSNGILFAPIAIHVDGYCMGLSDQWLAVSVKESINRLGTGLKQIANIGGIWR